MKTETCRICGGPIAQKRPARFYVVKEWAPRREEFCHISCVRTMMPEFKKVAFVHDRPT